MANLRTEQEVRGEIALRQAEIVRLYKDMSENPSIFDNVIREKITNLCIEISLCKWFLNEK